MFLRKHFGLIFVFLISLIPLFGLLKPGLPITHDGIDHVARIASFYQNLEQGNLIPRWAGNLNWGYGHPILMFLYPLPSYIASFIHSLGFSFIDSLKIEFGIAFIASGIFMYLWVRNFLGEAAGIAAGILYMFAPYRFIDLYVRGALGEHLAFVFIPLVLYFLLKLSKSITYPRILGLSLSLGALILSHNAISLITIPFIVFYLFFLFWQNKDRRFFISSVFSIGLGFLISFFFWFPAFMEGKYTLRDIVTAGEHASRFVNFKDLIYGPWNYGGTGEFSVQIGLVHIALVLLSLLAAYRLFKKKDKTYFLYLVAFAFFIFSIFMMLKESNFIWTSFTTLQKLQFPWRFLTISVFASSLLGAFFFSKTKNTFSVILLALLLLVLNINYWHANGYTQRGDDFFKTYKGTTDTGESSPIWSIRFMEEEPKDEIEVIEGRATIKKLEKRITHHKYEVNASERVRIRENTLYFPGWNVLINGTPVSIEFQDPKNRGLMTFFVEKGKHNIDVEFSDTKVRLISNYVSLLAVLSIIPFGILFTKKFK